MRAVLLLALLSACAPDAAPGAASDTTSAATRDGAAAGGVCEPLETRPPNASGQEPAFEGQTRACAEPLGVAFRVEVVTDDLEAPWAVEPLPDGRLLVTERTGQMRLVSSAGAVSPPLAGVPAVDDRGQGGLLDVALSPTFATDSTVFWSFSEPRGGGENATSVARGRLAGDRLTDVRVILQTTPAYDGDKHFGSRLAFGPDGMLYVTTGERSDRGMREHAQRLDGHLGKVLRITPDGDAPADNPFADGEAPEVWSYGHRNVQSAVFDPSGTLWTIEHGPAGGDELNRIEAGANYGWPVQTYGEEYSGLRIRGAETDREGIRAPVYYWDPVIAPSGAEVYTGAMFPAWQGSLFIGALREMRLVRLTLRDGRVAGEEHLLVDRGQRVRDVRQGPDGALYVVTDSGELWRLTSEG